VAVKRRLKVGQKVKKRKVHSRSILIELPQKMHKKLKKNHTIVKMGTA